MGALWDYHSQNPNQFDISPQNPIFGSYGNPVSKFVEKYENHMFTDFWSIAIRF